MADDNDDNIIPLAFEVSNVEALQQAQAAVRSFLDDVDKARGGIQNFTKEELKLNAQLENMTKLFAEAARGDLFTRQLNAAASEARNVASAAKEMRTELMSSSDALGSALASGDINKIIEATRFINREIDNLEVKLQQLKNIGNQADEAAIASLTRRLEDAQRSLQAAQEAALSAQRQAGLERGMQARANRYTAGDAYSQTAAGQEEQRAREEREAAQAEDRERRDRQRAEDRAMMSAADAENRSRTREDQAYDKANLTNDTRQNPDWIAARKLSNTTLQGQAIGVLGMDDEAVAAAAQAANARLSFNQKVADKQKELNPGLFDPEKEPEEKAKDTRSYWDRRSEELLGDGGSGIFAFHAQIQAQYEVINGVFEAMSKLKEMMVEFDKDMNNIGATTGATNNQLETLRASILDISTKTPFSAPELAKTGLGLAEKGVSAGEITSALPNIANLASATGSSLGDSGEIFSAGFENFKLSGAESVNVADQLTVALNKTRLSAENFDQAILAGQETAKANGLSFSEMNAALGALANQGLRSGSLLGTALSSVLKDLQDPPAKLAARFAELGVTQDDLNVKTHGLVGVLTTLKDAGFTASDAYEALSARQAKAFAAAIDGSGAMQTLYTEMMNSSGAAQLNAEKMDSLGNTYKALGNTMFAIVENASRPLIDSLKLLGGGMETLLGGVSANSRGWTVLGTVMEAVATASALRWVTGLIGGMTALTKVTEGASLAFFSLASLFTEGAIGAGGPAVLGFIALTAAIGGAITLMEHYESSIRSAEDDAKAFGAATKEASDKVDEHAKALDKLNDFYIQTSNRSDELKTNNNALQNAVGELRNQFGTLTSSVYDNIGSYDQLLGKITQIRSEIQNGLRGDLAKQAASANAQVAGARAQLARSRDPDAINALGSSLGLDTGTNVEGVDIDPAQNLQSQANTKFGANSTLAQMLKAAQSGDTAALLRLYPQAPLDKSISADQLAAINAYADNIATSQRSLGSGLATSQAASAGMTELDLTQSQGYTDLSSTYSGSFLGQSRGLDSVRGDHDSQDAAAKLAAIKASITEAISNINTYVDGLDAASKEAFPKTPLAHQVEELQGKLAGVQHDISERVTKSVVDQAGIAAKSTADDMQLFEEEMRTTKGSARQQAFENYKTAALANYNEEVTEATAGYKSRLKTDSDTRVLAADLDLKLREISTKYQTEMLKAKAIADHISGNKADPNRQIAAPPTNYAGADARALAQIQSDTKNAEGMGSDGLSYAEAYLNTEKSQPGASKVDIKKREDDLAKARLAYENARLAAINNEIALLAQLMQKTKEDLAKTQAAEAALLSKSGVKKDAQGNIDPSSFRNNAERVDFMKQYDALEAQIKELQKELVEIARASGSATTQAAGLQGQVDARNSVPPQSALNTAQAALNDFTGGKGGDSSSLFSFSNEANTIKTALDGANTSLSDFFTNLVNGTAKGKNAFRDFATSIIKDMENIVSQQMSKQILGMLGNLAISAIGGGWGDTGMDDATGVGGVTSSVGSGMYHGGSDVHAYTGKAIVLRPPGPPIMHKRLHFFGGGPVPGPDIGRDSVPAMLAGGESVLNGRATQMLGSHVIDSLNAGVFGKGVSPKMPPHQQVMQTTNVFVVDKSTVPQLGPKDVLATIGDDIRNNGATKKLIKSVINGG